jgi:hypothetical protein
MSDQIALFEVPEPEDPGSIALSELLRDFAVVEAYPDPQGSFMIVTDRESGQTQLVETVATAPELGYSSPSPWTSWTREEWNPKLRDKLGITEYYRMKRLDGIIRGSLRAFKTPVLSAHWFMKPGGESAADKNAAKFIQDMFENRMNVSWSRTLEDILLMCEYGYMPMEKVYALGSDGKVFLRKLAPRHPADIQAFQYDANGGPAGIVMEPKTQITEMQTTAPTTPFNPGGTFQNDGIPIPISKLAIFSLEAEAGDLQGISILRSAYKHYKYKDTLYKIDAIQKERHGIGVPVIKMPPGWNKDDKKLAEQIGRNLRTNERSHITIPPQWEIYFAKLEGQPVDCMGSINHHNDMIMANVLAQFVTESDIKKESLETFYKATRYVAETVSDTMNRHVIQDLVEINWSRVKAPKLIPRRIGEWEDARTQSFTLRNYVGAGLIRPDDRLEAHLREENDLPEIDWETRQEIVAPQDPAEGEEGPGDEPNKANPPKPARTGPPRQSAPSANAPRSNAGVDRSGGN